MVEQVNVELPGDLRQGHQLALQLSQPVQGFQCLAAVDGLGTLVAQLLPLGRQGIALLPEVSILNETFVMEPLESVGFFIQIRQGRVQLVELGVTPLLSGGDFFQEGEGGGEDGIRVSVQLSQ